jgi:hypothetical protein
VEEDSIIEENHNLLFHDIVIFVTLSSSSPTEHDNNVKDHDTRLVYVASILRSELGDEGVSMRDIIKYVHDPRTNSMFDDIIQRHAVQHEVVKRVRVDSNSNAPAPSAAVATECSTTIYDVGRKSRFPPFTNHWTLPGNMNTFLGYHAATGRMIISRRSHHNLNVHDGTMQCVQISTKNQHPDPVVVWERPAGGDLFHIAMLGARWFMKGLFLGRLYDIATGVANEAKTQEVNTCLIPEADSHLIQVVEVKQSYNQRYLYIYLILRLNNIVNPSCRQGVYRISDDDDDGQLTCVWSTERDLPGQDIAVGDVGSLLFAKSDWWGGRR